jgi:hypothetical protein
MQSVELNRSRKYSKSRPLIGWREWAALPLLGVSRLGVKIDTGAKTSALHAHGLCAFRVDGRLRVCFVTVSDKERHVCVADVVDQRWVMDSGGDREFRYVIRTDIVLGEYRWPIELTLSARHGMRFPMLLGRRAVTRRFWVNPARSFLHGTPPC